MENLETSGHYVETLALYRQLFRVAPEVVAVDMHPDYLATRYGLEQGGKVVRVQHHHAHLAACLADGDADPESPAIGVIMDGTGYGLDGHIWGGEFLVGDGRGFQRAAHLQYLPLPGGDQATHKPYRLALAYLCALLGDAPFPSALGEILPQERETIAQMVARGLHTPLTSSAGRLFDAVSALLGVCREISYEAQAAIALEMVASTYVGDVEQGANGPQARVQRPFAGAQGDRIAAQGDRSMKPYPYALELGEGVQSWGRVTTHLTSAISVGLAPLFAALLDEIGAGVPVARSAWRLHLTIAEMMATVCERLREATGLERVALSGGCFQNRLLLELLLPRLQERGFRVLMHRQAPCNDGGLALGQAVVAHYVTNGD
jgi:hydrogenase maturation protein HypF